MSEDVSYTVEAMYDGWRLDKYLCARLRGMSRTRVQKLIDRGGLSSERPLKASSTVWPGLTFAVRREAQAEPETPRELPELFHDENFVVLDKPAGLPVHPTARYHHGTLVGRMQERYGEGYAVPAHRLDRETSGVLVCTRTTEAARGLARAFRRGEVDKEYLAICEGTPPDAFEVDAPIAEGGRLVHIAVRIDRALGKEARTRFVTERRFERDGAAFALVRAYPETGRQHQIRVHLREAGYGMVGDKIYGPDEALYDRFTKRELTPDDWARLRLPRQALHACRVSFVHPNGQAAVSFASPLPTDLAVFAGEA